MWELLKIIIIGKKSCVHKWETIVKSKVFGDGFGNDTKFPTRIDYTCRCKNCGEIKVFEG